MGNQFIKGRVILERFVKKGMGSLVNDFLRHPLKDKYPQDVISTRVLGTQQPTHDSPSILLFHSKIRSPPSQRTCRSLIFLLKSPDTTFSLLQLLLKLGASDFLQAL